VLSLSVAYLHTFTVVLVYVGAFITVPPAKALVKSGFNVLSKTNGLPSGFVELGASHCELFTPAGAKIPVTPARPLILIVV